MDELNKALERMIDQLGKAVPELVEIMDRAKAGTLTEDEAMALLVERYANDPSLQGQVLDIAKGALGPLHGKFGQEADYGDPIFDSGVGLPQLNPLYEAALIERLQFDGDIPEARTGPLPEGTRPAVSVETKARNPAAVGRMLDVAADQVYRQVEAHEGERRKQIEAVAEAVDPTERAGLILQGKGWIQTQDNGDPDFQAAAWGSRETDLAVYRRGEVPGPVRVEPPSGSALAAMSPSERRENAFRFLSTTQGRRTALAVIRELVATKLRGSGATIVEREFDHQRRARVVAHHKWTIAVSGPNNTQAAFDYIETASRVLARRLADQVGAGKGPWFLEVLPENTVDIRSVGWAARLVE